MIPLLIPLIALGTLATVITQKYVKEEINKNNINLLLQTKENIELILSELDSLNLNFSTNPAINVGLKRILRNDNESLTKNDFDKLSMIKNFVDSPANSRPYIHSIYVYYYNNKNQFLSTTSGITTLNNFYDTSWYTNVENQDKHTLIWTEMRDIKQYDFAKESTKVLTIYRKLYSPGSTASDGVIVLNICAKYIESLLNNLETLPEQSILIVDENNQIIFRNHSANKMKHTNIEQIYRQSEPSFKVNPLIRKKAYTISQIQSERYGWKYLSIVPQNIIYEIPIKLSTFTFIILALSFISGLSITYYLTSRNYKNIQNIISIIDSAENNQPLPALPSRIKDEYSYILHNIVKTFVEHSYLKVQLSERKYKVQAMELLALQSQINPHFLFNTLETINWKVLSLTGHPNDINEMIGNLSDILKYSLESDKKSVTIKEEIKYTQSYINIQKARYKEKFDVIWEYDENLTQHEITKLLLQPLIENSIYHGIRVKEGKSCIKIKIHFVQSFIKISVVDNGLGINRKKLIEIREKLQKEKEYNEHIGLFNTNKRLKLTYGDQYGIKIRSKSGFGTAVYMYIPI